MYFLRFPEHTDSVSLLDIIRFVFVIESQCVFCVTGSRSSIRFSRLVLVMKIHLF
jgi:hypothetical protein